MTQPRLLFVHAHPDDESSKGAATAARYVDDGARVALATCTGGEAGEVLNPSCEPPDDLAGARRRELEAACEVIGFHARYDLGYADSGYHEDPTGVPEGTFARIPVDEPAADLAAIIRQERPHVVVTYPPDGGYPHPDHVMTYEVTERALTLAEDADADLDGDPWRVPKVYACHAFPPDRILALHEAILERGDESPFEGWMERQAERRSRARTGAGRAPDEGWPCDTRVYVSDHINRRDEALRRHVTQVDPEGMWFAWPRDLEREVFPWECFTRLRSDVDVPSDEDDLLAGLEFEEESQ